MAKVTPLTDIANLQNESSVISAVNGNNDKIEAAFANTISRDGSVPNTMGGQLDMNDNRIINMGAPAGPYDPVRVIDITGEEEWEIIADINSDADQIVFVPVGTIAATDVQAAVAEVATDAATATATVATDLSTHIADTSAAHAATAISFSAGGNIAATNVQTAIDELDDEKVAFDVAGTFTKGFDVTSFSAGTKSSGTFTPTSSDGHKQHITANGAFTLAPPGTTCNIEIEVLNGASAGAITTSGFTRVVGDTYATTNGNKYLFYVTKTQNYSMLNVVALQ